MELNALLAYAPELEIHHLTMSILGGNGGRLDRERDTYLYFYVIISFSYLFQDVRKHNQCGTHSTVLSKVYFNSNME